MFLKIMLPGIFCVLAQTSLIQSQYIFNDISLDSFRLPFIVRNSLDGRGTLSGFHSQIRLHEEDDFKKESIVRPTFDMSFNRYYNSPELQTSTSISVVNNFTFSDDVTGNHSDVDELRVQHRTSINTTRRIYNGASFIQKGLFAQSDYEYARENATENGLTDKEEVLQSENTIGVTMGFGFGRIEQVSDLAMAMFLLQDAVNLGLNENKILRSDLFEFAGLMATVRFDRILDSRRKQIHELRQLYQFMLEKDWVVRDDPGYFTVLTDNWLFNELISRSSGTAWSFTFSPSVTYFNYQKTSLIQPGFQTESLDFSGTVRAAFDKYQQVNLNHGKSRHHLISGTLSQNLDEFFGSGPQSFFLQFNTQHGVRRSWFPNSRSNLRLGLQGNYTFYHWLEPSFSQRNDQHLLSVSLNGDVLYYLSYRTRVTFSAEAGYGLNSGGSFGSYVVDNFFTTIESSGFYARLNGTVIISIF